MKTPIPKNEAERLKALYEYEILDTQAEKAYDDLTRLATYICRTPIAAITLIDSDRQWLKSKIGISESQTPRDVAFCSHAILESGIMVVPDALDDVRFRDNPLVTDGPKLRFYAGSPITTSGGYKLGTLCVIDTVPRELSNGQMAALRVLGRQVMMQMELRRENRELRAKVAELEANTGEKTQEFHITDI